MNIVNRALRMNTRQNCVDADCFNGAMIDRYEKALKWIVDQVDNEDADLDDIILVARKALEPRCSSCYPILP